MPSVLIRLNLRLNSPSYRWELCGLGSNYAHARLRDTAPGSLGGGAAESEAALRQRGKCPRFSPPARLTEID